MKNKAKLLSTLLFSSVFFSCSYVSNKPITITGVATPTPIPVMTNQIKNTDSVSLSPSISEISIIKAKDIYYDDEYKSWAFKVLANEVSWEELKSSNPEMPVAIRIVGKNYMMFNRLIEAKIDGELAFGHSTAISKDIDNNLIWESIIFIPNRDSFSSNTTHSITYSTPFGSTIRIF